MSYSTKFMVLFTLAVSLGFMGCSTKGSVGPDPTPPAEPAIAQTSLVATGSAWAQLRFSTAFSVYMGSSSTDLGSTTIANVIGSDWTITSSNFVYCDKTADAPLYLPMVDSSGTYNKYLKMSYTSGSDTVTFEKVDTAPSTFYSPSGAGWVQGF